MFYLQQNQEILVSVAEMPDAERVSFLGKNAHLERSILLVFFVSGIRRVYSSSYILNLITTFIES